MSVDEVVKLVLAIPFSFSLLLVTFYFVRLLSRLTDLIVDANKAVADVAKLTNMTTEDYTEIRGEFKQILETYRSAKTLLNGGAGVLSLINKLIPEHSSDKQTDK